MKRDLLRKWLNVAEGVVSLISVQIPCLPNLRRTPWEYPNCYIVRTMSGVIKGNNRFNVSTFYISPPTNHYFFVSRPETVDCLNDLQVTPGSVIIGHVEKCFFRRQDT
jgi:hypothetical protein